MRFVTSKEFRRKQQSAFRLRYTSREYASELFILRGVPAKNYGPDALLTQGNIKCALTRRRWAPISDRSVLNSSRCVHGEPLS